MNKMKTKKDLKETFSGAKDIYLKSGKVPQEIFDMFTESDHTPTKKYVEWMCREYYKLKKRPQHVRDVALLFMQMSERGKIPEKDIYKVSLEEAEKLIAENSEKATRSERDAEKKTGAKIVYEDEIVRIFRIDSYEASCLYGAGADWCTKYAETSRYFHDYHRRANLYYAISKVKRIRIKNKKTGESSISPVKVAIIRYASGKTEYYNMKDTPLTKEKYEKLMGY